MRVDLFDFELPPERIALRPARPRDSARLLLVEGRDISDRQVLDLPELLQPGDVLVFNDTKVIPAQLEGQARRGEHRRDAAQARRAARLAGLPAQRQARAGRDAIEFGAGVARVGGREGRRTARRCSISTAMSRSSCCSSAPGGCRCRPTSRRRRAADDGGSRRLPDDVRARGRGGGGADRRAAFHAAAARCARRARRRRARP